MKSCILIPAYNCYSAIAEVVSKIKALDLEVVVVDDGSVDETGDAARSAGATVLRHDKNMGKGASMIKGFNYILKNIPCDWILTMDGDGQHNPEEIKTFLAKGGSENEGIVVGNRMSSPGSMPIVRRATNFFMSGLISFLCGQRIYDTQCGFRLIRCSLLESIRVESRNYDIETEMLIRASQKGYKITSLPIEAIYKGEVSRINPFMDTLRFFGLLARIYLIKK